jgi:K+-sensing histidine kinase KdpD
MTLLGKELLPILTPDMNTQPTLWLRVAQYGMAVALTLATYFLREHIAVSFGQRPLLILFMLPIIISALLGGLGSGLLATLTVGLCTALLIPPADSLAMAASYDILQWGMLLINGILVSLLSGSLHH